MIQERERDRLREREYKFVHVCVYVQTGGNVYVHVWQWGTKPHLHHTNHPSKHCLHLMPQALSRKNTHFIQQRLSAILKGTTMWPIKQHHGQQNLCQSALIWHKQSSVFSTKCASLNWASWHEQQLQLLNCFFCLQKPNNPPPPFFFIWVKTQSLSISCMMK